MQHDIGQMAAAMKSFEQGLAFLTPLASKHPGDQVIQERFADLRSNHAILLAYLGQHEQAAAEATEVTEIKPLTGQNLYYLACAFAAASGAAQRDEKLPSAERTKRSERYAERAVEFLTRSRDYGFLKQRAMVEDMKKNKDIDPLRSRADYRKLLADIESELRPANK